jgi:ferredoxin/flavodoxin---NADP+ reductase
MSSHQIPDCYDIIIVGGGPVGLFAAYYAGLRDMKSKIIDRRHELGGQLTAIYPEKWVYDIPGIPAIRGKHLFENLEKQIAPYNIPVSYNEEITHIRKNRNNILRLEGRNGSVHHAKAVLLCLGMGAHIPRRMDIPNLVDFEGRGVHYGVHSLEDFRGKRVLVVGGGDSALDMALTIVDDCKDLVLVHRSDRFNAHEETVKKLYSSNAEIRTYQELCAVDGEGKLKGCTLRDTRDPNVTTHLDVDAIIIAIGLIFNLEGVKDWGIELEKNAIVVDHDRRTSMEGIYAAGDIATYPGKMKLIGTGAAEAMQAINHAKFYIQETFPYL